MSLVYSKICIFLIEFIVLAHIAQVSFGGDQANSLRPSYQEVPPTCESSLSILLVN